MHLRTPTHPPTPPQIPAHTYTLSLGTGKTWIARAVAKLLRQPLMMASLNEYTKNEDLISRTTFGEEAAGRTGITKAIVLNWMEQGGVLLLDELHKPLDGLSVLNNILQYGEFRMSDGQVVRLDPARCHCVGTMNPVRPPYRGEVPSAELVSRFATVLSVDFLPAHEEVELLRHCTDPAVLPVELLTCLVDVANDLRKSYPTIVPLPVATRTLLDIVRWVCSVCMCVFCRSATVLCRVIWSAFKRVGVHSITAE
jgi:MoxR-like ATPase